MRTDLWLPAEEDRLRDLWNARPTISAAEIGRQMNRTKNQVVGKAHRMNLTPRPSPIAAPVRAAWTEALVARLRFLWIETEQSETTIGQTLGFTKNQVAAQRKFLGLPARREPRGGAAVLLAIRSAQHVGQRHAPRRLPPVARLNFQHRDCQWIEGEAAGAASRFCRAATLSGSSYCPGHHARCYTIPERREAA